MFDDQGIQFTLHDRIRDDEAHEEATRIKASENVLKARELYRAASRIEAATIAYFKEIDEADPRPFQRKNAAALLWRVNEEVRLMKAKLDN